MSAVWLPAYLAAGLVLGTLYFGSLWWNARLYARGGSIWTTIALIACRFVLLGGVLTAVSLNGAMPLLVTALGVLIARPAVMRRVRTAAL